MPDPVSTVVIPLHPMSASKMEAALNLSVAAVAEVSMQ
jgi:hypothetical protein